MKTVCKKLLSLVLVAMLLVSAIPFQASAIAVGDPISLFYCLDGSNDSFYQTTGKLGYKLSKEKAIGQAEAEKQYYGMNGNDGKEFVGWYNYQSGQYVKVTKQILSANMLSEDGVLYLHAIFDYPAEKINLKPNGGKLTGPKTHEVKLNYQYNYFGAIADPVRDHYNFTGWKTSDGAIVYSDSYVTSMSDLTAQWALKDYTVWFERYDIAEGWVGVENVTVKALSTLKAAEGTFPADTSKYTLEGWTIVGWEIGETDAAFKAGSTKVEKDGLVIRPRYQKDITLYADDQGKTYKTGYTVELGEPIAAVEKTLPYPGVRNGQTFKAWYTTSGDLAATKDNLSNLSAQPQYYPYMGDLWGAWEPSATVFLYFYTNNDTRNCKQVVKYYEAPADGDFDLSKLNLYELFDEYGKYDDNGDKKFGWYTKEEWKNYCAGLAASPYDIYTNLVDNGLNEFYVMLVDNGNNGNNGNTGNTGGSGNNYNNNSNNADSSNPTTGDAIFAAVAVMAVSASALALVFFLNKKKMAQ